MANGSKITLMGLGAATMMLAGTEPSGVFVDEINHDPIPEAGPPPRVSLVRHSPFYRPDYPRIGVKLDGQERNDVQEYNVTEGWIETIQRQRFKGTVEVFWRYPETRQMRRKRLSQERKMQR